jgi:hypothetical protein
VMAAVVSKGQRRRRVAGGRPARVVVRFTVEELAAVSGRAVAAGLTVPSDLAWAGLRPEGVEAADAKSALTNLVGVRRVLAGVASNLNQLTRKAHATGELDPAVPAVLDAVVRLVARTQGAVEAVAVMVGGRRR